MIELNYSYIKADVLRIAALREIGGFRYAGNRKLGAEDQILANDLRGKHYMILKDASLRYRLGFGRSRGTKGLLKSEANAGKTLGVAVSRGLIDSNPGQSPESAAKRNTRITQVGTASLLCLSVLPLFASLRIGLASMIVVVAAALLNHLRKSRGFAWREKAYFVRGRIGG